MAQRRTGARRKKARRRKAAKAAAPPRELAQAFEAPGTGPSFEAVRAMTTPLGKTGTAGTSAQWGVFWGNPQFPIFFQLLVNGQVMPPPRHGEDGSVAVEIVLKDGQNRLGWNIRHTGQGWRNQVWVKVGNGAARLLKADQDPSPGAGDDLSSGTATVTV